MIKSQTYLALVFLVVFVLFVIMGSGSFMGLELPVLLVAVGLIWWLLAMRRKELGPRSKRTKGKKTTRTPRTKPSPRVRPTSTNKSKNTYVDQVAADLRETARNYEDPLMEVFFKLGGIQIRRHTKSQNFTANAHVQFARSEFVIDFINVNSRTNKARRIRKKWKDSIGVLEDSFELFFQDESSIVFIPLDQKSHLYFSVFWQVFHDGMNGGHYIFQNPLDSGLGHRLREVASYLVENKDLVGPKATIDVSVVPTRMGEEEFLGFLEPKFPELRDKVRRWRLIEKIGEGGFGQVFAVQHVDTGEHAALKLMSPSGPDKKKIAFDSPWFRVSRERFLDEASLSMKVSSPFVVSAIDSSKDPWPWIMYPLVKGKSVAETLQSSPDRRATWWNLAHDLISGLSTIHTEGLLHKDVKPENMLHAGDRFVLLDFGIGEVVGYSDFSAVGGSGGTFGYMAPEVLLGGERAQKPGFEIDIFSAGMTLLSFFDTQPLRGLQIAQQTSQANNTISPLTEFVTTPLNLEGAPQETRTLLAAMLDFNPSKRSEAKHLLSYVAGFVDLEVKLELIQSYRAERIAGPSAAREQGTDEQQNVVITERQTSWKNLEEEIHKVLVSVRPEFFTVTVNGDNESTMLYVQAITSSGSWHVEAMSEAFASTPQSADVKKSFMRLNWSPPTPSEPNYSFDLYEPPFAEIVRLFTDAFEFGYGLRPWDLRRIEVASQGTGKY